MSAPQELRVLTVLNEPFNRFRGAGITMENLFGGLQPENLGSLYWSAVEPDRQCCRFAYRLQNEELTYLWPLNHLVKSRKGTSAAEANVANARLEGQGGAGRGFSLRQFVKAHFATSGIVRLCARFNPSRTLQEAVKAFNPTVVYCAPAASMSMKIAEWACRMTQARLAVHIYDDWPLAASHGGLATRVGDNVARWRLRRFLKKADLRLAISEGMAREYEKNYGVPFQAFHNCPEGRVWIEQSRREWAATGKEFVFRFAGAIYAPGNMNALGCFTKAVGLLRQRGMAVGLELILPQTDICLYRRHFEGMDFVRFLAAPEQADEMACLYAGADALLLPYDQDPQSKFRLSTPTKLPAYLLSASPLFVMAPRCFEMCQLIEKHQLGLVQEASVTAEDLAPKIAQFMADAVGREAMARRAQAYAVNHLSAEVVQPRFASALRALIDGREQ